MKLSIATIVNTLELVDVSAKNVELNMINHFSNLNENN